MGRLVPHRRAHELDLRRAGGHVPRQTRGIALYAHEGWRKYFTFIGPIATFGYWFAWSSVLAIFGTTIGYLVQAEWAAGETWTVDAGAVDVGFPHVIGAICVILVWLVNIAGIRPTMWMGRAHRLLLVIPIIVLGIIVYATGDWSSANLTWTFSGPWGGWKLAIVWLYIIGWTAYGIEVAASFAPEYKNTRRDTSLALKAAGLFTLGVYVIVPLGTGGIVTMEEVAANPIGFWIPAFEEVVGGASDLMVVILIAAFLLAMNAATADGGRALYGIARDHMTIKQLYHLNSRGVPARAMTIDMVVNLALIFFVATPIAILVAGNLGYMAAHFFAVGAFVLLRKDRPNWPRPIKLPSFWIPIADHHLRPERAFHRGRRVERRPERLRRQEGAVDRSRRPALLGGAVRVPPGRSGSRSRAPSRRFSDPARHRGRERSRRRREVTPGRKKRR